jgi:hypothetical protein
VSQSQTHTQPPNGVEQLTREQLLAKVQELSGELAASKEREAQSQFYIESMKEEEDKEEEEEDKEEEEEEENEKVLTEAPDERSQREIVRKSRESIHHFISSSPTSLPFVTPVKPPITSRLATAARKRRESHGNPIYSPPPSSNIASMAETKGPSAAFIKAANMMSKNISHFYGDSTKDTKQDVRSFVKSVKVEFDTWMPNILEGRLQLVIRCTRDYALDWLCEKQRDLKELSRLGVITNQDLLEWGSEVEEEFIKAFAGESTESQWQTKLNELRLGGPGRDGKDVSDFIAEFKKIASHLFPLSDYADTKGRSKILAHLFSDRVRYSNTEVWKQAYQGGASLNTLEEWELALRRAWEVILQVKKVERRQERFKGKYEGGRGTTQKASSSSTTSHSTSQSLLHMSSSKEGQSERDEGENERGEGEGEMLQAAMTERKQGKNSNGPYNKYIKRDQAMQLIRARRCLLCYKEGHVASSCKQPASRGPTAEELKGRAGQQ